VNATVPFPLADGIMSATAIRQWDGVSGFLRRYCVSVLFTLVTSSCAAAVAAQFVTMWRDRDGVATAALAVALLPVLVLAMMAWGEAL
jgi:hypothetical protein